MAMVLESIDLPLEEIARYCAANDIVALSVFGSAARGKMTPESDIDLLVTFREGAPIGLISFVRIQEELAGLLGRPVDLVTPKALKPFIRDSILNSAIQIYALG